MSVEEFDLDRSVSRAWSRFRRQLADLLEGLRDDLVLIEANATFQDEDGSGPFAQVFATGGTLQAEISSNVFLAARSRLDDQMTMALTAPGWRQPTQDDPNFTAEIERSHADRLAAMIVAAFRDVWNVPHPTFLDAGKHNAALGLTTADLAIVPTPISPDRNDLQRLVDDTVTRYLGELPLKDSDGDLPVRSGSALVFIRVLDDLPLVELKSPLVVDIEGRTRAAEIIADLNAAWRQAKFILVRDVVVLVLELPTEPFVPEHLTRALAYVSRLADDLDDELAERLGGRLPFVEQAAAQPRIAADPSSSADLPPELLSLLHLPGDTGDLTAIEVAQICGQDRDTILRLLSFCTAQEISWRRAADEALVEGLVDAAGQRDAEADVWQDLVERLRTALREVLVRPWPPAPPESAR